jgi:hypothetical protein
LVAQVLEVLEVLEPGLLLAQETALPNALFRRLPLTQALAHPN